MSSIGALGSGAAQFLQRPHRPPSFSQLDTNGDNTLSLNEFGAAGSHNASGSNAQSQIDKLFAAIDSNGDGSISADEKSAFDQKMVDRQNALGFQVQSLIGQQNAPSNDNVFASTDTNSDGSVSLAELSNDPAAGSAGADGLQKLFNLIDTNGDGSISKQESSAFLDAVKSAVAQNAHQGHHHQNGDSDGDNDGSGQNNPVSTTTSGASTTPPGLYSAALGAYNSTTKAPDLLATLQSIFEGTA